jgi:hypothetical protein
MKIPTWINYAVAGYGKGNKSSCFTNGWCIGLDTRRGRFVMWCINTSRAIRGKPSDFKYWLADVLSKAALRLRGDATPRLFGYWEDVRGNRAAEIADRVNFDLVLATNLDDRDHVEKMNQIHEQVGELAALARSTWHHEDPKPQANQQPT